MCFHLFPTPCSGHQVDTLKAAVTVFTLRTKSKITIQGSLLSPPWLLALGMVLCLLAVFVVVVLQGFCFFFFFFCSLQFSSVQSFSHFQLFVTPWNAARQASLSITNSRNLPKFMSIVSVMPSNHRILCRPLLLLPLIFPSIRVFSDESTLHTRWPKYWSFSFSISPSKEIPGLISFKMDWLDLLEVQGTLKSLLQHHSSKASILRRSAFFTVQLSHPYWPQEKP